MKALFNKYSSAVIALSGGIDSAAVLKLASDFMGHRNIVALTCINNHIFNYEIENARKIASVLGVKWIPFNVEMPTEFFKNNDKRCYYCKSSILNYIENYRLENSIDIIFDGTNIDDLDKDRPGFEAVKKYNVVSPLLDTQRGKDFAKEIVKFFENKRIGFYDESCIATRIKDQPITNDLLKKIEKIEDDLRKDYPGFRLRIFPEKFEIEFKNKYKMNEYDRKLIYNKVLNYFSYLH